MKARSCRQTILNFLSVAASLQFCIPAVSATDSLEAVPPPPGMVLIPSGSYKPFTSKSKSVPVRSFLLDRHLVTNRDYLKFVRTHPNWQKSSTPRIFADAHYLNSWKSDFAVPLRLENEPVVDVSWFAAKSYCESLGKRITTTDQWEFTLDDLGRNQDKVKARILNWYGEPNKPVVSSVDASAANGYGVSDLTGLVWEWTEDFGSFLSGTDTRDNGGKDLTFVCGNGSQMGDASDYASFMRYSFRSSLKANYTTSHLGFRCSKNN
jgi:sulfatase modifying factor 1